MPIYEYQCEVSGCDYCEHGFEALQGLNDTALAKCPECGVPIKKKLSTFAFAKSVRDTLSPKNLERNGFTQYKKVGDGTYEKTLGRGPKKISKG